MEIFNCGISELKNGDVHICSEIGGDQDIVWVGWTEDSSDLSMGEMKWPCEI